MATAIIPARGGSKGLPRKNLHRLFGRTLLDRAVETCRKAGGVDAVIVSTEDAEIAEEAEVSGAQVCERPPRLAADDVTSQAVLRHTVEEMGIVGTVAFVQCTNPFMTSGDIEAAIGHSEDADTDMSVCVHETHDLLVDADGSPINWDTCQTIRQQRDRQYRIVGSVWAMSADYLIHCQLYDGRVQPVEAQCPVQLDIDTMTDALAAEALMLFIPRTS